MHHIADDDLIAYALEEAEQGTRTAADAHLESCEACRTALDEIRATLALASRAPIPERDEHYEAEVWARLEPRLGSVDPIRHSEQRVTEVHGTRPTAQTSRRAPSGAKLAPLLAAAAALVLVAGAFWLGRQSAPHVPDIETVARTAAPATGAIRERVVLAALGEHLDRTERTLVEVMNADGRSDVDLSAEQAWARDLLDANRLYRQAAQSGETPALSQVLNDLEPVLLEIANSPARLTSEEFRALRERIEAHSLVFKVRVTGADVRARQRALLRPGEL